MLKSLRLMSQWEWVILLLLLPLFMFPQGARALVLLAIPLLLLVRKQAFGSFIPSTPYNLGIMMMVAMIGLSLVTTFDLALSLPKIAGLLVGISLMYATVNFSKEQSVWPIVSVLVCIGGLIGLVGLIASNWQPPFEVLNRTRELLPVIPARIPGTHDGLINANELAGVLCWTTPLMLALSIGLQHRLWRRNPYLYVLLLLATILSVFVLIATASRGGILAFGLSSVLVLAFFVTGRWRLVLAIGLVTVAMGVISYATNIPDNDIVGDALGLSGRVEIWSRALLALGDNPLTGVSVNGFRQVVHILYPMFGISSSVDIAHAHNHLLQAGLDLGVPGLIGYLALWIVSTALIIASTRNLLRRKARRHPYFALVAGLAGSLLGGWVFGIFDAVALGSRPAFIWWIIIGLCASLHYAVVYSGKRLKVRQSVTRSSLLNGNSRPH